MSRANNFERQMLALINQERAAAGVDPLRLNVLLNDASEDHSQWMIDTDIFSHTGAGGSSAGGRMESASYPFEGNWTWGENIAWQSERGPDGIADDVVQLHQSLMNSPGHRANILNPRFDEIGIGIERGDMRGYDGVVVTQNFAATDGNTSTTVEPDATPTPTPPPPPTPPAPEPEPTPPSTPDALVLNGTRGNDRLVGADGDDRLSGNAGFDRLIGGNGNDSLDGGSQADNLFGGAGNDVMLGGAGFDRLFGGNGNDIGLGGAHNDALFGQNGADRLHGQSGNDRIFGGFNNDRLAGGNGNDQLFGGAGFDTLTGDAGDDRLSGNFNADRFVFVDMAGGFGRDTITDFAARNPFERIDLSGVSALTNLNDLFANHLSQVGEDVRINAGNGSTIILLDVNRSDLDATDFIF